MSWGGGGSNMGRKRPPRASTSPDVFPSSVLVRYSMYDSSGHMAVPFHRQIDLLGLSEDVNAVPQFLPSRKEGIRSSRPTNTRLDQASSGTAPGRSSRRKSWDHLLRNQAILLDWTRNVNVVGKCSMRELGASFWTSSSHLSPRDFLASLSNQASIASTMPPNATIVWKRPEKETKQNENEMLGRCCLASNSFTKTDNALFGKALLLFNPGMVCLSSVLVLLLC